MTADGNFEDNMLGISKYSQNDVVLLKLNTTSHVITQNSICDCLNGNELSTSAEIDEEIVYQFGQKDNIYILVMKYNLTNFSLLDQRIYQPETSFVLQNFKSFYSRGIANNGIVCLYLGSESQLGIINNFEFNVSLDNFYFQKIPLEPGPNAKLVTTYSGDVLLFIPLYRYGAVITRVNITDFSNPQYSLIGSMSLTYVGNSFFADHCFVNFIDTGLFLFYFASLNINSDRQYQISLLKISYNLNYLDSCIAPETNIIIYTNYTYNYQLVSNISLSCQVSSSPTQLDTIESSEFSFNDTSNTIWPRPDVLRYDNCKPPGTKINNSSIYLSFEISDSTPNIFVNISQQCQGVPINQTTLVSILPDVQSNFLNFLPNGVAEIVISEVTQIGVFNITISNQMKLLSPNMTNFRTIKYVWDDPITFALVLINQEPTLDSDLGNLIGIANEQFVINFVFIDNENDHVMIRFDTDSVFFDMNANIEEIYKNNYTVTWTPSINDIGVVEINLFFFDQFHTANPPVNFQIKIYEITIPSFANNLTDTSVLAGQQTHITLPSILNPSNASINFRIDVTDPTSQIVDSTEWMKYSQSTISLFPKCELLGSETTLELKLDVYIYQNSKYSFMLTIKKNETNFVCDQADISFVERVLESFNLLKRINISGLKEMNISIITNKPFYGAYFTFDPNNNVLLLNSTSINNQEYSTIYLSFKDSNNTEYNTNKFNLRITQDHPPVAVFSHDPYIFYYGNLINLISFAENPFIDESKLEYTTAECYANKSGIVSYSILNNTDDEKISIKLFFVKDFIGKCNYSIIASDVLNQTSLITLHIQVVPCAQTDCIRCSGPYQIDCELCANGYALDKETGTCYFIDYTISYSNPSFIFIICIFIVNILLSVASFFLGVESEICSLVIYINQSLLILCLFESTVSNNFLNFMSILQLSKLDFKLLDVIFYARNFVNSNFYDIQYVNMKILSFASGSTFANFINLLFVLITLLLIFAVFKIIKKPDVDSEITSCINHVIKLVNFSLFVSIFKLSSCFIVMNCLSELFNQFVLDSRKGDMLSYTISDFILILILFLILFQHKFKPKYSVFSSQLIIENDRINLIKMSLFALCFILKDSWIYCRRLLASIQLIYICYLFFLCKYVSWHHRIMFIIIQLLILLVSVLNSKTTFFEQCMILMVTFINILICIYIIMQIFIKCIVIVKIKSE